MTLPPEVYQCPRCHMVYVSRMARDLCEQEDRAADRDARRR